MLLVNTDYIYFGVLSERICSYTHIIFFTCFLAQVGRWPTLNSYPSLSWSFAGVSLALLFFIVSSSSMSFRRAAWFSMIGKVKSSTKLWFCWSAGSGRITFGVVGIIAPLKKVRILSYFLLKTTKYSRLRLICPHQNTIFVRINHRDELRVPFNIGSQWSVSREIGQIKHSVELSGWWIKRSQLYTRGACTDHFKSYD